MASQSAGIGSALPDLLGNSGLYLTTDGSAVSWAAVAGGSGVDTLGAIGSSPNANAGTITSTTLVLQPASGSFGGVVTTGTQTFAGTKTFAAVVASGLTITSAAVLGIAAGETQGALWLGPAAVATPGDTNYAVQVYSSNMYLNSPSSPLNFCVGGATVSYIDSGAARLNLTGLGAAGGIVLKRTDGTTVTLTVNNSNALVIA